MGTPTPPQGGTIDVKPSDLHRVAGAFAGQQTPFDKAAKDLVTALEQYPDAGGYGTAAQAFATAYVEVGNRYLEVWARSVVSVGGAAVGFATTANNYSRAEAANDASGKTPAQVQAPPVVIDKAPDHGPVPDLKWGDDDGGDDFIRSLLEYVPDVVWHILRPLLEHAFRWGKVAEVYPFPQRLGDLLQSREAGRRRPRPQPPPRGGPQGRRQGGGPLLQGPRQGSRGTRGRDHAEHRHRGTERRRGEVQQPVDALTPQLRALKGDIDEAYRQAPTYAAEEARVEAFGARSLNEFKKEHKYTKDDEKNHFYPLDLANDEGLYGGHSIDKHMGLSDDQLKGRLRDDSSASSASTFTVVTSMPVN
ncbi:hypothetical protein [Streptomyces sp. LN325]|uniref:hypothetical protein n=1 Tax=Streptomyces sp. LN325 TaxID=3112976 RepID=UPI0037131E50